MDIDVSSKGMVTANMKALAKKMYLSNKRKLEANKEYESARKELFQTMQDADVKDFYTVIEEAGKQVILDAEVSTASSRVIDLESLKKLVNDDKVFMSMLTASAKAVTEVVGTKILEECSSFEDGNTNVSVSKRKKTK